MVQKTLWGRQRDSQRDRDTERERERKRENGGRLPLHPDSPCLKNPAGADWHSLGDGGGVGWGGRREGRESQHDKDEAKTGHRLTVCYRVGGVTGEQKLC